MGGKSSGEEQFQIPICLAISECRQQTLPNPAGKVRRGGLPQPFQPAVPRSGRQEGSLYLRCPRLLRCRFALDGVCRRGTTGARSTHGWVQLSEKVQVFLFPPEPREPDTVKDVKKTVKKEQELTCFAFPVATEVFS